jgi:hypothetical protein
MFEQMKGNKSKPYRTNIGINKVHIPDYVNHHFLIILIKGYIVKTWNGKIA